MAFFRTIVAALIAFAVALLPATGKAIISPSPAEMMMTDQADMPCCPLRDLQGDFKAPACALQCVVLSAAILPGTIIAPLRVAERSRRSFVNETSDGLVRAPPTRPPSA